jgi:hypothetical protein
VINAAAVTAAGTTGMDQSISEFVCTTTEPKPSCFVSCEAEESKISYPLLNGVYDAEFEGFLKVIEYAEFLGIEEVELEESMWQLLQKRSASRYSRSCSIPTLVKMVQRGIITSGQGSLTVLRTAFAIGARFR